MKFTGVTSTIDQDGRFSTVEENVSWTTEVSFGCGGDGQQHVWRADAGVLSRCLRRRAGWRWGRRSATTDLKLRAEYWGGTKGAPSVEIDEVNHGEGPDAVHAGGGSLFGVRAGEPDAEEPGEEGLQDMEYIEQIYGSAGVST